VTVANQRGTQLDERARSPNSELALVLDRRRQECNGFLSFLSEPAVWRVEKPGAVSQQARNNADLA
jgi:hypothetical protein